MTDYDAREAALERNLHRLATEGLDAATDAAIQILRNAEGPAQARSATINAVFRVQGLFARDADEGDAKRPSEMTPAELDRAIRRTAEALEKAAAGNGTAGDGEGVFG